VRRAITLSKLGASIADLMLFDRSSLAEARNGGQPPYRILLSDRISAVERFKRRLPCVLEALSWHPIAVETMSRFGKFFENIHGHMCCSKLTNTAIIFGIRSGS
jgi:hypothetical protein